MFKYKAYTVKASNDTHKKGMFSGPDTGCLSTVLFQKTTHKLTLHRSYSLSKPSRKVAVSRVLPSEYAQGSCLSSPPCIHQLPTLRLLPCPFKPRASWLMGRHSLQPQQPALNTARVLPQTPWLKVSKGASPQEALGLDCCNLTPVQ